MKKDGRIELVPLENLKMLKGKYKDRLKTKWATLEEKSERFVRNGKR